MAPRSFLKRKPKMVVRASILARMLVKFSTHQSVWLHAALIVFVTQAALAKDVCDTQSAKGDVCLCELSDLQSWSVGVGVKRKLTLRRYQMRRVLCVPLSPKGTTSTKTVCSWHIADSLKGRATCPLWGVNWTLFMQPNMSAYDP